MMEERNFVGDLSGRELEVRLLLRKRSLFLIFGNGKRFLRGWDTGDGVTATFRAEVTGSRSGIGPRRNDGPSSQSGWLRRGEAEIPREGASARFWYQ
jgi:hypothetical protein